MEQRRLKQGIHTFVICAYKESPYLEECILSLKNQTFQSKVIMVTSTLNSHIQELAQQYQIPLFLNTGEGGIAQDWNFGIAQCHSKYVTIVHQDDVYMPDFLCDTLRHLARRPDALISFSDYGEIRDGKHTVRSTLLTVKKLLLLPLRIPRLQHSRLIKRRCLSLGNPICCPSVTYCMERLTTPVFQIQYGSNLDWQTWADLAKEDGSFVYIHKVLMYHRIHQDSTTSGLIENHQRTKEDHEMLRQFWPAFLANILSKFYGKGETLNSKS